MEGPINIKQSALVLAPSSNERVVPSTGEDIRDGQRHDDGDKESSAASLKGRDRDTSLKTPMEALKELTPISSMPSPSESAVCNRLAKQNYSRLGRNNIFEVRPAVVHFGGYLLGKAHSQRVRVVNISRTSQRLHILGPSTDCFKMRCNKKGLVAPGSSEVIAVDFHPREHRYHYDCLRLHTDSENLLVPVHAYPMSTWLPLGPHGVRFLLRLVAAPDLRHDGETRSTVPNASRSAIRETCCAEGRHSDAVSRGIYLPPKHQTISCC